MYLNEINWKVKKFSRPFPFAEVDHFLKDEVYKNLESHFPDLDTEGRNNIIVKREYIHLTDKDAAWKGFASYFVSVEFFDKMCNFYDEDIKFNYPKVHKLIKKKCLKVGVSGKDTFENFDVLLDFQIGINTAVTQVSSSRGPHLDNRKVFYVGLCYFKNANDPTSSGHYTAFEVLNKQPRLGDGRSVSLDQIKIFAKVEYSANRLATFLNTPYSVHGVSEREVTNFERKFFVFNAVMKEDLYSFKRPLWERVLNKLKRK